MACKYLSLSAATAGTEEGGHVNDHWFYGHTEDLQTAVHAEVPLPCISDDHL